MKYPLSYVAAEHKKIAAYCLTASHTLKPYAWANSPSDRCGKPIRFSTLCKTFCKSEEKNTAAILETNLLSKAKKKERKKSWPQINVFCIDMEIQ